MTFQRSLYISIAAHAMIFGAAIAFAWQGSGAFFDSEHVIPVSLISSDSGPVSGVGEAKQQNRRMLDKAAQEVKSPVEKRETPREVYEVPAKKNVEPMMPVEGDISAKGPGGDGKGDQTAVFSGTGQSVGGGGLGFVAPNQWAAIESAIEKSKNYPRMARERGIQGVVHVRFKLKPSGSVETVEIVKSSGYDILDDASVRTVYRASPMPYVAGWVNVPITYVLK